MTETTGRLFEWLISYHIERNLETCKPYIQDGQVRVHGRSLLEGRTENDLYKGVLVVADGANLLDRLHAAGVTLDEEMDTPVHIADKSDFFDYLDAQENNDGAYVFDSVNSRIARVYELNNHIARGVQSLVDRVPDDFVSRDGSVPARRNLGLKTRMAIKLPIEYPDIETFQIKRTAYGPLGMGKVTHFTHDGLSREFFFDVDPQSVGPFVEPAYGIVGVRRTYEMHDGHVVSTGERLHVPRRARDLPALVSSSSYAAAVA